MLKALRGLSTLPQKMVQNLQHAWQTSETVDSDYAGWANSEIGNCSTDYSANAHWQAAVTPNEQATLYKMGFTNQWNPLATGYGLPNYQWNQV